MFFEQYSHEPYIAVARHWIQHTEMTEAQRAQLPAKQAGGRAALAVMAGYLSESDWFGGEAMAIADFSLYLRVHSRGGRGRIRPDGLSCGWCLADPGGQSVRPYPNEPHARRTHYLPVITHSHQSCWTAWRLMSARSLTPSHEECR